MKKIIFIIIIIQISAPYLSALGNIYIEGTGAFTQTGDLKNEFGGGPGVLYKFHRDFNFFAKGIFNTITKDANKVDASGNDKEKKYNYNMAMGGIEYLFAVSTLPLFWKTSIGCGISWANVDYYDIVISKNNSVSDSGFCAAGWTGILYVITQNISTFFDIGYHKSFYTSEMENEDVMGIQLLIGLRFTAYGQNTSIFSEY